MARKRSQQNRFIEPPELPQETTAAGVSDRQLCEAECYSNIVLSNCQLTGAKGVTIQSAHFKSVQMLDDQFTRFDLSDIRFDRCDFANTEWNRAILNRIEFFGCRMLGFKVTKSNLKNTLVKDCQGSLAQFEFTKFNAVRFENCILDDANFLDADLSNVVFLNCDLRNATFSGAKLVGTDFRCSNIEGLQVSLEQLRGAIFDPLQAAYVLQRFAGVTVKSMDEEEEPA